MQDTTVLASELVKMGVNLGGYKDYLGSSAISTDTTLSTVMNVPATPIAQYVLEQLMFSTDTGNMTAYGEYCRSYGFCDTSDEPKDVTTCTMTDILKSVISALIDISGVDAMSVIKELLGI